MAAWDSDLGDEPAPGWRDRPPDLLTPIDAEAPISGHHPPPEGERSISEAPEHDWSAAASRLFPVLRPPGTSGTVLEGSDPAHLRAEGLKLHAQPLLDPGPADLTVAYVIRSPAFDVVVNADHLLGWGVEPAALRAAALENLGLWSAIAPWGDELSGTRRLLSSDSGEGNDAARILLPEVRMHLGRELGSNGRVLIGLPDRDLLLAGSMGPDDHEFAALFGDFVGEYCRGADEPVDRRVFELIDDHLVPYRA